MLSESYQKTLRAHLNESQYLTIHILLLLLQVHRQVKLSVLEACLSPTDSIWQSQTQPTTLFELASTQCQNECGFP